MKFIIILSLVLLSGNSFAAKNIKLGDKVKDSKGVDSLQSVGDLIAAELLKPIPGDDTNIKRKWGRWNLAKKFSASGSILLSDEELAEIRVVVSILPIDKFGPIMDALGE